MCHKICSAASHSGCCVDGESPILPMKRLQSAASDSLTRDFQPRLVQVTIKPSVSRPHQEGPVVIKWEDG